MYSKQSVIQSTKYSEPPEIIKLNVSKLFRDRQRQNKYLRSHHKCLITQLNWNKHRSSVSHVLNHLYSRYAHCAFDQHKWNHKLQVHRERHVPEQAWMLNGHFPFGRALTWILTLNITLFQCATKSYLQPSKLLSFMMYWLIQKLASVSFPQQKANGFFSSHPFSHLLATIIKV